MRRTTATQALAEMLGPETPDPHVLAVYDRQRDVQGFEEALQEARRDRDRAVRSAERAGVSRLVIRQVTGLSNSRISQIVYGRR